MSIRTQSFELGVYAKGDKQASKLALVMPGRLDTKDYPHMISHVEYLASRGFYALSFDAPGSWQSSGGINSFTMTTYLKAANELIGHFDNRPTFAVGHSMGGAVAARTAIDNPHVLAFAALMSGFDFRDYPDGAWQPTGTKVSTRDLPNGSGQREFTLPISYVEDLRQYNMTEGLKDLQKPKLFVLGKQDTIVEPAIIKSTYKVAARPKQLVELDTDHDYRRYPQLIRKVNGVIGSFLDTYASQLFTP